MHFTVLIIGKNPETQLTNYCEDIESCPKDILSFFDAESEYLEDYNTEMLEVYKSPTGKYYHTWEEQFTKYNSVTKQNIKVVPVDYKLVKIHFSEMYGSFHNYLENYHDFEKDPKIGKYGYWHNPQAKWDWYRLGGRWSGYFKITPDCNFYKNGDPDESENIGFVDKTLKKYIDFEGMRQHKIEKSSERYDVFEKEFKSEFGNDKGLAAFKHGVYCDNITGIPEKKEVYISRMSRLETYAVLKDNMWYEKDDYRGEDGVVDEDKWSMKFKELVDQANDDEMFSLYDCHI